jgi:hypothetical protein
MGRTGLNGGLEKAELNVVLEATEGEEPALPLHAVKRAVSPHCLADAGHVLHDERVEVFLSAILLQAFGWFVTTETRRLKMWRTTYLRLTGSGPATTKATE